MNDLIDETQRGRRAVDVAREKNKFDCVSILERLENEQRESIERPLREEIEKLKRENDTLGRKNNELTLQLQQSQAENVNHLFSFFSFYFLLFVVSHFSISGGFEKRSDRPEQ